MKRRKKVGRRRRRKWNRKMRRLSRRHRRPKVKSTSSQTIICVNGSQSLQIRTEKMRRGGRRRRKRRRRKRRRRKRRKRRRGRRNRRRRKRKRSRKKKRRRRQKRKRKARRRRKKKGRRKNRGYKRRYKRYVGESRLPEMPLLKVYSGVDENAKLLRAYFVTDSRVSGTNVVDGGSNPSPTELQSVVEVIDRGIRDEVAIGHRIGKRSTRGGGVSCYRVQNFGRREKEHWQYLGGRPISTATSHPFARCLYSCVLPV